MCKAGIGHHLLEMSLDAALVGGVDLFLMKNECFNMAAVASRRSRWFSSTGGSPKASNSSSRRSFSFSISVFFFPFFPTIEFLCVRRTCPWRSAGCAVPAVSGTAVSPSKPRIGCFSVWRSWQSNS